MSQSGSTDALVLGLIFFLVAIVIHVLFLISLSSGFKVVHEDRRKMAPAMVWLNLIPLVNLVWVFFTASRLGDSLYAEAKARGLEEKGDGTKSLGLAYAILLVSSIIPYVGLLTSIPLLVVWIIYWVKVVSYRDRIKANPMPSSNTVQASA